MSGSPSLQSSATEEAARPRAPGHRGGRGRIELIVGPMFSEKTMTLLSRLRRHRHALRSALLVKHASDVRYESADVVATHGDSSGPVVRQEAVSGTPDCGALRIEVRSELRGLQLPAGEDVVGIDEGQFFPDLIDECERLASAGKIVIVAALDGDFARKAFENVCLLVAKCETVEKLKGVCQECLGDSAFSQRLVPGGGRVLIGGSEAYRAVCRQCHAGSAPQP